MNTFLNTIKVMTISALGALSMLYLATHVSSNPVMLVIWALLGIPLALFAASPKKFVTTLRAEYAMAVRIYHDHKEKQRQERERWVAINKELKEQFDLVNSNNRWNILQLITIIFWFSVVVISLTLLIGRNLTPGGIPLLCIILSLQGWETKFRVRCRIDRYGSDDRQKEEMIHETKRLQKSLDQKKDEIYKTVSWPYLVPRFIIRWTYWNFGVIVEAAIIATAKTCYLLRELTGWCAAIGAISGYAIGWICERDPRIATIAGGVIGGLLFIGALAFKKFLPDPETPWPSLKTVPTPTT